MFSPAPTYLSNWFLVPFCLFLVYVGFLCSSFHNTLVFILLSVFTSLVTNSFASGNVLGLGHSYLAFSQVLIFLHWFCLVEFDIFWFYLSNFSFWFNFLWFSGCFFIWKTCGVCFGVSVWVFTFNDLIFILGCDSPFIPIFSHFFTSLSCFHSTLSHSELWPFYLTQLRADFWISHFNGLGCFGFLVFSRFCGI